MKLVEICREEQAFVKVPNFLQQSDISKTAILFFKKTAILFFKKT